MAIGGAATTLLVVVLVGVTSASTPAAHTVTAPPAPGTVTVTWTGTIPAGIQPTSGITDCSLVPGAQRDDHLIHLQVPASFYSSADSQATFTISWTNASNDEALTVEGPDGIVGHSDGGDPHETVAANNLAAGDYTVHACPFGQTGGQGLVPTTPQQYTGQLTFNTTALQPAPPTSDAQGLSFSASVPADPQRDEAEPLVNVDQDGNVYSCGPTGFSGASDYAQVSTDGGDQFHLLGEEPRGQQGLGGGGDCGLATGVKRNPQGHYQYAYAGLGPLTGFTTSTSPDDGHNITNAGPQGNTNTAQGGGADRQWLTFLDDHTVLMNYNQQVPRGIVVQKSTDGGLTYVPGNDTTVAPGADFPGPMQSMPARFVDPNAPAGDYVAYFGWNASDADFTYVNFAISDSTGLGWHNCLVRKIPVAESGTELGAFTVADNDNQGNIYLTYGDKNRFHSWLTTLAADKLKDCTGNTTDQPTVDPGWSTPVQVDRGNVGTTVFPWLAAGGEPGRVAVAFYGTESDGDPNTGTFKASWDVYVNQSLDALSANPTFSQVKATTHPFHYDSICLRGLDCDISQPPGDRSLADFFAIDYNPVDKRLYVVYDQGAKKPDEATGHVATPAMITQEGGPSNGGGTVQPRRPVVRTSSDDPASDAIADYSSLAPITSSPTNVPAMDFLSQSIGPEVNLNNGNEVADGGFNVKLKLADLSDAALSNALNATKTSSLLWIFRFVNGYQASAAIARWDPAQGFTFGYNDYTTASVNCNSDGEKCQVFPGDKALRGKVDQDAGTIRLRVPREYLAGLNGPTGPGERPTLVKADVGTRFYDGTAFSLGSPSPVPSAQTYLYPIDNPPAMDFLLPEPSSGGDGGGGGGGGGGNGGGGNGGGGNGGGGGGGACTNLIKGTAGKDHIKGTGSADRIRGRGGADRISGRGGDDCLAGQGGADRVSGASGDDDIRGGRGKDRLKGGAGADVIHAKRGARDRINCGKGKDTVFINPARDRARHCERVKT
jgi:hypothetical protein